MHRLWCRWCDALRLQWQKYRATFFWLVFWLVVGIIMGIVSIYLSDVEVDDINYKLLDGNLLNAASGGNLGNFIWQRICSIIFPVAIVFGLAWLSRVTALVIYPVVFIHGYWLAIAVWWVIFYYSFSAILLLAFYAVWLLLVTAVLLSALIWAMRLGRILRTCPCQFMWREFWRGWLLLIAVAVVSGICEYLVFWVILGKIVYKPL